MAYFLHNANRDGEVPLRGYNLFEVKGPGGNQASRIRALRVLPREEGVMRSIARGTRKAAVSVIAGAIALGLVVFCWPGSPANASGQARQIHEEVTVALKLFQAYVTTKDGKPVTDLTAADFEVTDNGKVVPVTHFEKPHLWAGTTSPLAPPWRGRGSTGSSSFSSTSPSPIPAARARPARPP